jgi:hypothetical protein
MYGSTVPLSIPLRMTLSFESDQDVIIYALEKIISYARTNQYIFLAQSVWWISSILGLQQGLIIHIDNLEDRAKIRKSDIQDELPIIHPDRAAQINRSVSATPRDLTEDQRLDRILECADRVVQQSIGDRTARKSGRINPLPTSKRQLKKARNIKRLQLEDERKNRLQKIRATVIKNLSKE